MHPFTFLSIDVLFLTVKAHCLRLILFHLFCRWHLVFNWRIWNWLSPYRNKCFFTMIMVLIVLFLGKQCAESDRRWIIPSRLTSCFQQSCFRPRSDAVREVQKYSGPEPMLDAKVNPNVYDHVHMKLFRAQRNLYISGFSLFLWLSVSFLLFIQNNTIMFVGPYSKTLPLQKKLPTCLLNHSDSLSEALLFLLSSGPVNTASCVGLSPC